MCILYCTDAEGEFLINFDGNVSYYVILLSFQIVEMRKRVVDNLRSVEVELEKRKRDTCDSPSPSLNPMKRQFLAQFKKSPTSDHPYSQLPPKTHLKAVRSQVMLPNHPEEDNVSRASIEKDILREIDAQLDSLCVKTENGSVLGDLTLSPKLLCQSAFEELRKRVPFLFKVLATAAWYVGKDEVRHENCLPLVYAMLMRSRNQRFTAFQHALTSMCLRYHANNQVL